MTNVQTRLLVLLTVPPGKEMLKEVRYVLVNVTDAPAPLLDTSEPIVPIIESVVSATAGLVIPPRITIKSETILVLVKASEIVMVIPAKLQV